MQKVDTKSEISIEIEAIANGIAFLTERGAEVSSAYPIEVLMSDEASYITGFNLEVTEGQ